MGAVTTLGGSRLSPATCLAMELGAKEVSSTGTSPVKVVLWEPNLVPKGRFRDELRGQDWGGTWFQNSGGRGEAPPSQSST